MRMSGLYRAVAGSSFRRYATYRVATAAGVFTNTVFGFFMSYTFIALWDQRPGLGGYDQAQALTFVWVGQGLLAATAVMGGGFREELQERIRTGEISIDLYRPVDLQLWWLAVDLGRSAFQLLGRGIVPVVVGGSSSSWHCPPTRCAGCSSAVPSPSACWWRSRSTIWSR